jgi:hypothetical protein
MPLAVTVATGTMAAPLQPAPPQVPLWTLEADGDAVQNGLGFILPARWQGFERKGFTSTRPDGGSVMAWYERPDGKLQMRILLQLRIDVRGMALPASDSIERHWPAMIQLGAADYRDRASASETLAEGRIPWGGARRRRPGCS